MNERNNQLGKLNSSRFIRPNTPVLASLDIGSTKVSFIIGTVTPEGKLEVVGVGNSPNVGIKQGVVVNIEATTEAIRKAKEEAELMSGYKVSEVWLSISGNHIQSFDSKGMVAIKNKEVTQADVERVIEAAKAVAVPVDRSVLHILPREYKIDGQDGILSPVGMSGIRLEASVHIVTAAQAAISNLMKCLERASIRVAGMVLDPLASSYTVLSEDEKNLGVCLIDIGGGSTKLIYFVNGAVAYTSTVPVGAQHFTHDVAVGLRTPQVSAEILKKKHGCAMSSMVSETETIEVEGVGGRKARAIPRKDLADILEARAEETLQLYAHNLRKSGLQPMLGSGVVFTGGGSQLDGLVEMSEFIFDIPVRRGLPANVGGLTDVINNPEYATAVGLLVYVLKEKKELTQVSHGDLNFSESLEGISKKVKDFFGSWM